MIEDKNLGEVAVFPSSDDAAALARMHQKVKGSDYSFLVTICKGPPPPQHKRQSEAPEKVQQKDSNMAGLL